MNRIPTSDPDRFNTIETDMAAVFRKYPEAIIPAIHALTTVVAEHDPRRRNG